MKHLGCYIELKYMYPFKYTYNNLIHFTTFSECFSKGHRCQHENFGVEFYCTLSWIFTCIRLFHFYFYFRRQRVSERSRKDEMKMRFRIRRLIYTFAIYTIFHFLFSLFLFLAKRAGIPFLLVPKIHSILYFHFKLALKNKDKLIDCNNSTRMCTLRCVCECVRVCVPLVTHSQNLVKRNVIHDRRVYDNERKRLNVHNIFDGRDKIKRY